MRFELIVQVVDAGVPAIARLKRFLKGALRGYGIRCVSIRPLSSTESEKQGPERVKVPPEPQNAGNRKIEAFSTGSEEGIARGRHGG